MLMKTRRLFGITLGSLALIGCLASSADAATLNVVDGQLVGASDVLVDGALYDVEFVDGTCIALFAGCDANTVFTFGTWESALQASQALLDQVFIDDASGMFDSDPSLTCRSLGIPSSICISMTPFQVTAEEGVYVAFAINEAIPLYDETDFNRLQTTMDTVGFQIHHYARWTPVPEPSTASLLGLGLLGIAVGRRRSRAA